MAILGDNTQGGSTNPGSSNRALLSRVTAVEAGTINAAYAYFGSASTAGANGKVLLYTDTGSGPGTLVAASSSLALPAGGGLVGPFTMSGSFGAGDHFLGIVYDNFQSNISTDNGLSGVSTQMANGTLSFSSPPASWPGTDITYSDVRVNVYLDYTASGGGGPTITVQPSNQSAIEGATATFSVTATGSAPITYQWQKDAGGGFADISGATSSSYTTPALTLADDADLFRCQVTDTTGGPVASSSATLTVTQPPAIEATLVGGGASATATVTTAAGAVTATDVLLAVVTRDPGVTISSISDTVGNSYGSPVYAATAGAGRTTVYKVDSNLATNAANVLTVVTSGAGFCSAALIKLTPGAIFDTAALVGGTDATSPYGIASGVFQIADTMVIGIAEINAGSNGAYSSSNMDLLYSEADVTNFWTQGVFKKAVSSNAAFTPSITRAGSSAGTFGVITLGFKAPVPSIGGHGLTYDFLGGSGSSVTTPAFNSQAAGSSMLAIVARGRFSDFPNTVTDSKGNTYTQVGTAHTYTDWPTSGTALFAKEAAIGGSAHTVTTGKPLSTDEVTIMAVEVTGVNTVVDSAWVEDLTSPNTSASVTTTGPGVLVAFWAGDDPAGELNPAVAAPWSKFDWTSSLASNHVQVAGAYRRVTAAGTYTVEWTPTTAQGAQLWLVALQDETATAVTAFQADAFQNDAFQIEAAAGGTGTHAVTLDRVLSSGTASVGVNAASSVTLGPVGQAAASQVSVRASAAQQLGPVAQAAVASAVSPINASSAVTLGAVSQVAAGQVSVRATSAQQLGAMGQAAASSVGVTGSHAVQLGAVTQGAAASLSVNASMTVALGPVAMTGLSSPVASVNASANQLLGAIGQAAASQVSVRATASHVLGYVDQAAAARVSVGASMSVTFGPVLQSASSSAVAAVNANASQLLGPVLQAAAGVLVNAGRANVLLSPVAQAAAGRVSVGASSSVELGYIQQAAVGRLTQRASSSVVLGDVSITAAGSVSIRATCSVVLGPILSTATNLAFTPAPSRVIGVSAGLRGITVSVGGRQVSMPVGNRSTRVH